MKSLPLNLIVEKNKLDSSEPWVMLLKITLPDSSVLRLANNTEDVIFASDSYGDMGCIAHWKMNDNKSNTDIVDSTGNDNTGTALQNTEDITVTGKINSALAFNGTNDFIAITHDAGLNVGDNFSYSFWVKRNGGLGSDRYIIQKGAGPGAVRYTTTNKIVFDKPGTGNIAVSNRAITDSLWHYIVVTKNGAAHAIYIDGVDDTLRPSGNQTLVDNASDFALGSNSGGTGGFFKGDIDDVRIFNKALTQKEITYLYNNNVGTENNLPVIYRRFSFEIDITSSSSKSEIPSVTLRVSNVTRFLQPYLESDRGLVGSMIKLVIVHTGHLMDDHSMLEVEYEIMSVFDDAFWVYFTLGAPNPLKARFPLERYLALHCSRWQFREIECGYVGKVITGITQASPGVVTCASHGFLDGDKILLEDVDGMPEVNDIVYTIISLTNNTFHISIDTSGYDAYSSGGLAGYAFCDKSIRNCVIRANTPRFGGHIGMKAGGLRLV